jgi:hypothetical protein
MKVVQLHLFIEVKKEEHLKVYYNHDRCTENRYLQQHALY